MFSWDETKRRSNLEKHGVDFNFVAELDWDRAVLRHDRRKDYGEDRLIAFVFHPAEERLYVAVLTPRPPDLRLISLRKANHREQRDWRRLHDN